MSDITASERRLSAALDRLDNLLESGTGRAPDTRAVDALTEQLQQARDRAESLERDLDRARSSSPDLSELQARLEAATEHSARLAAANEDLVAANRNLIDADATGGIGADERLEALEAEIGALRAARSAEMAQMSEIMAELERLLADEPGAALIETTPPAAAGKDEER